VLHDPPNVVDRADSRSRTAPRPNRQPRRSASRRRRRRPPRRARGRRQCVHHPRTNGARLRRSRPAREVRADQRPAALARRERPLTNVGMSACIAVAERLQAMRSARKLTVRQLALQARVNPSCVRRLEDGWVDGLGILQLTRIAAACKASAAVLPQTVVGVDAPADPVMADDAEWLVGPASGSRARPPGPWRRSGAGPRGRAVARGREDQQRPAGSPRVPHPATPRARRGRRRRPRSDTHAARTSRGTPARRRHPGAAALAGGIGLLARSYAREIEIPCSS
jgi:hypothetical protein